ncbi:MAG: VWA domain-containing protein [Deltaproteobacteria bacterium]|nr:VWA domain-containing protein [Deltaproteobacteria bacterium]
MKQQRCTTKLTAWPLFLGLPLLVFSCQDYKWSPNTSPVCNETDQSSVQPVIKSLDILFVIDNSGSMAEEQKNMADNFNKFIKQLVDSDADYQIGVVTTDLESGKGELITKDGDPNHKIIKSTWAAADIQNIFSQNIQPGINGSNFEKGLGVAKAALSPEMLSKPLDQGGNKGFLRNDSTLGIVFVSDENDCSYPPSAKCPGNTNAPDCISESNATFECDDKEDLLTDVSEFYDFFVDDDGAGAADTGLRPPKKIIVAAITGIRDDTSQEACVNVDGNIRKLDIACWALKPDDVGGTGTNGVLADPEGGGRQSKFTVDPGDRQFSAQDVTDNKYVRIKNSTKECDNGVWPIKEKVDQENSVMIENVGGSGLFEADTGLDWEVGVSPGFATEGTRYQELVKRFPRGFLGTICTFDWGPTLERLGAVFTLKFEFCLADPPAGLADLLAKYGGDGEAACPEVENLVNVKVDNTQVHCNDPSHPWRVVEDKTNCPNGSGFKVEFYNSARSDCNTDPPGPKCFPQPGQKAQIFYLSQEGNSERCVGKDKNKQD